LGEGAVWQNARAEIDKGWKIGLENLQSTLETGHDLRVVDRPLIGIYPEDLAPQKQKELGIPVSYGVRVSEVIPGYGAEKAGIQPNDVIVAVNGQKIENTYGRVLFARPVKQFRNLDPLLSLLDAPPVTQSSPR